MSPTDLQSLQKRELETERTEALSRPLQAERQKRVLEQVLKVELKVFREPSALQASTPTGIPLGRVALDDWKLGEFFYLPLNKYARKAILVSGASGSGKTVAAKVIVEELLDDNIPVLGFGATKQWERLKEKNTDDEVLTHYRLFGTWAGKRLICLYADARILDVIAQFLAARKSNYENMSALTH